MIISAMTLVATLATAGSQTIPAKTLYFNVKAGIAGRSSDCESMTAYLSTLKSKRLTVSPKPVGYDDAVVGGKPVKVPYYCTKIVNNSARPQDRSVINFTIDSNSMRGKHKAVFGAKDFYAKDLSSSFSDCERYMKTINQLSADYRTDSARTTAELHATCRQINSYTVRMSSYALINP